MTELERNESQAVVCGSVVLLRELMENFKIRDLVASYLQRFPDSSVSDLHRRIAGDGVAWANEKRGYNVVYQHINELVNLGIAKTTINPRTYAMEQSDVLAPRFMRVCLSHLNYLLPDWAGCGEIRSQIQSDLGETLDDEYGEKAGRRSLREGGNLDPVATLLREIERLNQIASKIKEKPKA